MEEADSPPPRDYEGFIVKEILKGASNVHAIMQHQKERCVEDQAANMDVKCPVMACEAEAAMVILLSPCLVPFA